MASSILAARSALKSLLAEALPGVQVTFGPPYAYEDPEVVAILGTINVGEEPEQLGQRRTSESFGIVVQIKVHQIDGTAETTATRSYELAETVRSTVHDNLTLGLGGAVLLWALTTGTTSLDEVDPQQPSDAGGWLSYLRVIVECEARIT